MTVEENPIALPTFPLHDITIVTVVKVIDCNIFHNEGERPWNQISIGGFALDGMGNVVFMDMMFSADDDDSEEMERFINGYTPGSLHWVEDSAFDLLGGGFHFYAPETRPVSAESFKEINAFFPIEVKASRVPRKGEFWYAGRSYVAGKGSLSLGKRPYCNPYYGTSMVEHFNEDYICQLCGNSSVEPFATCSVSEQPVCSDCAGIIREFCLHYDSANVIPPDVMLRLVELTGYPLDECCAIWLYQELDALVSDFRECYEGMDCASDTWSRSTITNLQYRLNNIVDISKKLLHPSLSRTPQAVQHMKLNTIC